MNETTTNGKTTALTGRALKALRSTCPHANVIELGDGVQVCTRCEAVLRAAWWDDPDSTGLGHSD